MNQWLNRPIGILLAILLAGTPELYAAGAGEAPGSGTPPAAATAASARSAQEAVSQETLPDSPGTLVAKQSEPAAPQNNGSAQDSPAQQNDTEQEPATRSQSNTAPAQSGAANSGGVQSENGQQPVGAAAAQLGRTTGGAASKPAGAALAPTQQHRTRSLVLKLGLLAGAGVAVGTVAALSKASPSKPPGH